MPNISIRIGNRRGGGVPGYVAEPFEEKSLVILETLLNTRYNWYATTNQVPSNKNNVIMTWVDGDNHIATHDTQIKIRKSIDKGATFGTATVLYHPTNTNWIIQNHSVGFTSDGRYHVLISILDNVGVYHLLYLYSDNNGTSFTETDISTLMIDVNHPIYLVTGNLIENNGVLIGGIYRTKADTSETIQSVLRLVSGSWTKVDIAITAAYENEVFVQSLDTTHLIILVRDEVSKFWIQYSSADNGLTFTRLGLVNFGLSTPGYANFGQFSKFKMNTEDIIVWYFPQRNDKKLYSVYARANDLIQVGIGGWCNASVKIQWTVVTGSIQIGTFIHYNDNYNARGFWTNHISVTKADLYDLELDTTDYDTLNDFLFPELKSYTADADSNAFNAVVNTNTTAIINLVGGMKAIGVWTQVLAVYPMLGGTAALHKYNLCNPADSDAAYRLTFSGTWVHSATGALPNGIDACADTHLLANAITLYSGHLGYYSRTNVSASQVEMGAGTNGANYPSFYLKIRDVDNVSKFKCYKDNGDANDDTAFGSGNTDSRGFTLGVRSSNIINKIIYNGIQSGVTNTKTAGIVGPGYNIFIGAFNYKNTKYFFSTKECTFATIGYLLTDYKAHYYYKIVQRFQTELSRNV